MISEKYRCVFVHIPKTGGTSITKALGHIDRVARGAQDHRSIRQLRKIMLPEDFDSYFKFTFVRNSWARVASWYKNVVQDPVHRESFGVEKECSFREFLTTYGAIWGLQSQLHWIRESTGAIPLNFIGRFENLQDHFAVVCQRLGMPPDFQLPHLVKAHDTRPYTILYDDETRDIVADRYAEEIELFGFEFMASKSVRVTSKPIDPANEPKMSTCAANIESLAQRLVDERPKWVVKGSLGPAHSHYLLKTASQSRAEVAVEIGTASGFSTTVLCHALNLASHSGLIGSDYHVVSYDISTQCLFDHTRSVGDAARDQLPKELLSHVVFRNPATTADFGKFHSPNEIGFLFIDGNHKHPWTTLDLLAALPYLAPLATVVLHDINLPLIHPQFDEWGAKFLFDGLNVPKDVPVDSDVPNIGSFVVPEDKTTFETHVRDTLYAHEWQVSVGEHYLRRFGLSDETTNAVFGNR